MWIIFGKVMDRYERMKEEKLKEKLIEKIDKNEVVIYDKKNFDINIFDYLVCHEEFENSIDDKYPQFVENQKRNIELLVVDFEKYKKENYYVLYLNYDKRVVENKDTEGVVLYIPKEEDSSLKINPTNSENISSLKNHILELE